MMWTIYWGEVRFRVFCGRPWIDILVTPKHHRDLAVKDACDRINEGHYGTGLERAQAMASSIASLAADDQRWVDDGGAA